MALINLEDALELSPHEDFEAMQKLYANVDFYDDVNKLEPLEKQRVIAERMKEIAYFKKMGVYRKY